MLGIETVITDHAEVFFGYVHDKPFYEFNGRKGFFYINVVFVTVIVEGNERTIVFINAGRAYNRPAKITADIFDCLLCRTVRGLGVDIKTVRVIFIGERNSFFKRRAQFVPHSFKKSFLKSFSKKSEIKVEIVTPYLIVASTAFSTKNMDMGIPF